MTQKEPTVDDIVKQFNKSEGKKTPKNPNQWLIDGIKKFKDKEVDKDETKDTD